jgi:hypothetical protein
MPKNNLSASSLSMMSPLKGRFSAVLSGSVPFMDRVREELKVSRHYGRFSSYLCTTTHVAIPHFEAPDSFRTERAVAAASPGCPEAYLKQQRKYFQVPFE